MHILLHTCTYCLSEGGQLLCLHPAEDVESVGKGRDEENVGNDEGGEDVLITLDYEGTLVPRHIERGVGDLWRGRSQVIHVHACTCTCAWRTPCYSPRLSGNRC